jgi:hypothetical protein
MYVSVAVAISVAISVYDRLHVCLYVSISSVFVSTVAYVITCNSVYFSVSVSVKLSFYVAVSAPMTMSPLQCNPIHCTNTASICREYVADISRLVL